MLRRRPQLAAVLRRAPARRGCGGGLPLLARPPARAWHFASEQARRRWCLVLAVGSLGGASAACSPVCCDSRAAGCPQAGDWRQDRSRSESLAPFLAGLGVPRFAAVFVDALRVDLHITCSDGSLRVTDSTWFGRNTTEAVLGADEVERATRTGRKRFMLSGFEDGGRLVVQCRLFQRGDGWVSQQSWAVREDGCLEEHMLLRRPGEQDVVVTRLFQRLAAASGRHAVAAASAGGAAAKGASASDEEATKSRASRSGMAMGVLVVLVMLAGGSCRPSRQ